MPRFAIVMLGAVAVASCGGRLTTDPGHSTPTDGGSAADSGDSAPHDAGHRGHADGGPVVDASDSAADAPPDVELPQDASQDPEPERDACSSVQCAIGCERCIDGVCVAEPDGTGCDDGNACTQTDTCGDGVCLGQDPLVCPPADSCHSFRACEPATGCALSVEPDGTPCAACGVAGACQQGTCSAYNPVVEIGAGGGFSCARKLDGTVFCWGGNSDGQLGIGELPEDQPLPVQVHGLSGVAHLAVGWNNACALMPDGSLWCWGWNGAYLVAGCCFGGYGLWEPKLVSSIGPSAAEIALGEAHYCVRKTDGSVWCWGLSLAVGTGVTFPSYQQTPAPVTALGTTVTEVAAGWRHTCARTEDSSLYCWGDDSSGQIGDGYIPGSAELVPFHVASLGTSIAQVALGHAFSCALALDGSVWCWGNNGQGQVGDGTHEIDKPQPVQVATLGTSVIHLAAGASHSCALKADGSAWCWGSNTYGQIGDGTLGSEKVLPVQVSSLGAGFAQITAGSSHTCALRADHSVWCWGSNFSGELGDGTKTGSATPVKVESLCPGG